MVKDTCALHGLNLCIEATREIMPLMGDERIESITRKYGKTVKKYPEQWAELTLATLHHMIDQSGSISSPEKLILFEFLSDAATHYDAIQLS